MSIQRCLKEVKNSEAKTQEPTTQHCGEPTRHICDVCHCEKKFYTKTDLYRHNVFVHKKKTKFYCKICKTYWINKGMYGQHMGTHSGERRLYNCGVCDRKYKTIGKFKVHRALHFERKLLGACRLCLKRFSNVNLLLMHRCDSPAEEAEEKSSNLLNLVNKTVENEPYTQTLGHAVFIKEEDYVYKPLDICEPKTVKCKGCGNLYLGKPMLEQHLNESVRCANRKHISKVCVKTLTRTSLLPKSRKSKPSKTCGKSDGKAGKPTKTCGKNDGKPSKTCEKCGKNDGKPSDTCEKCGKNDSKPSKTCLKCGKSFSSNSVLKKHSLYSKTCGTTTIVCEKCKKSFHDLRSLHRHRKNIENCEDFGKGKPLECEFCERTFQKTSALKLHMAAHTKERNHECLSCGMRFLNQGHLSQHYNRSSRCREGEGYSKYLTSTEESNDYICEVCGRQDFSNMKSLRSHRISFHSDNAVCSNCGASFKRLATLQKHQKESCMGDHECKFCGLKGFQNRKKLIAHLQEHDPNFSPNDELIANTMPFKCDRCHSTFIRQSTLIEHQIHVCAVGMMCQFCAKSDFRDKKEFRKHMTQHDPNYTVENENVNTKNSLSQDVVCTVCFRSFNSREKKEEHMAQMHGSTVVGSSICINTFSDTFKCRFCGAAMKSKKGLNDHEKKVHVAKVPCDVCGKSFRPDGLIMHKRTHTGDMPFSCQSCGKRFKSRPNLNYHIKVQKCGATSGSDQLLT